jgi:hypothetical protein
MAQTLKHLQNSSVQELTHFFYEGPENKRSGLCAPYYLC